MAPGEPLVAPVKGPQCSDYAASEPLKQQDSSSRTRVPYEVGLTTSDKKGGDCVFYDLHEGQFDCRMRQPFLHHEAHSLAHCFLWN